MAGRWEWMDHGFTDGDMGCRPAAGVAQRPSASRSAAAPALWPEWAGWAAAPQPAASLSDLVKPTPPPRRRLCVDVLIPWLAVDVGG